MPHSRPPISLATRLVPWLRSWRAGLTSVDEVVAAVTATPIEDVEQWVADGDDPLSARPVAALPAELSGVDAADIHLVLPIPGDVRGLPTSGSFASRAVLAGEAVVAGSAGIVPVWTDHRSGSGDEWRTVSWHRFALSDPPVSASGDLDLGEADEALSEAVRRATSELAALDVAKPHPALRGTLRSLRGPETAQLPPGFSPRASRLYSRALMLDAVLRVAESDALGGAVTADEAASRAGALRDLGRACRGAVLAACHSRLSQLLPVGRMGFRGVRRSAHFPES